MTVGAGRLIDISMRIKAERPVGVMSPMRKCTACCKRRSIGQFVGASDTCIRCKRRNG